MIDKSFLASKVWKEFRKKLMSKRKTCQLTGSKLTKRFNVHHLDTKFENYTDISNEEHFACLNPRSHDMVEFVWKSKDWRKTIKNLEEIMLKMEELK